MANINDVKVWKNASKTETARRVRVGAKIIRFRRRQCGKGDKTMERTILTKILEGDGGHVSNQPYGGFSEGTRLVVYEVYGNTEDGEQENGFYSYLDGVKDGLFGETDDMGPFSTAEEAEQAALDYFDASKEDEERTRLME